MNDSIDYMKQEIGFFKRFRSRLNATGGLPILNPHRSNLISFMLQPSKVNKILVIKLRAIGDVLLSTVVLDNLRAAFPHASIDFLTEYLSSEVVTGNPALSSILVFDSKRENSVSLIAKVRRRRYDLVFDLFGNPRSAMVTYFSGAAVRVGYRFGWRQYCYNIVVEPRGGDVHNTEFNLDALRAADISVPSRVISFPVDTNTEQFADKFFATAGLSGKFVIAVNPGGGWYTKRWRIHHYAKLGDMLVQNFRAAIVIVWGPGEKEDAGQIQRLMKSSSILIPKTTLKQLASILRRCSAMVTNDSGPMHIAAAMNTPVVAIFGPTNPELQGPVQTIHEIVQHPKLVCLGCNFTSCPIGNPCMEELSVQDVFDACKRLVRNNQLIEEPSGMV